MYRVGPMSSPRKTDSLSPNSYRVPAYTDPCNSFVKM